MPAVPPKNSARKGSPRVDLKARYVTAISGMEQTAIASRSAGERMGDVIATGRSAMVRSCPCGLVYHMDRDECRRGAGHSCFRSLPLSVPHVCRVTRIDFPVVVHPDEPEPGKQAGRFPSHLDLQINLLAEQESTKMLQMLLKLCEMGICLTQVAPICSMRE
jgi:hypothetical protein